MAISSTDCRERVADGEPVWYLVPDGVVQYINKHHLYAGGPGAPTGAPPTADEESRASH
jgi:nicotinate-nucleotide adenylyltransferase